MCGGHKTAQRSVTSLAAESPDASAENHETWRDRAESASVSASDSRPLPSWSCCFWETSQAMLMLERLFGCRGCSVSAATTYGYEVFEMFCWPL